MRQDLRSSFYIHLVLLVACAVFLYSLVNLLFRSQLHLNCFQNKQKIWINDEYLIQTKLFTLREVLNEQRNLTVGLIDELPLRRKILGTDSKIHSIFNRFEFLNPPKSICANLQDPNNSMIIIVHSRAVNLDYRQAIRATWGRNGKYKSSDIFVQTIFFVGVDDSLQSTIRNEQTLFNDVIEINVPDRFPFASHKELAALFWLRLYCPSARILFRIDDDLILDTFLLLNHIEHQINFDYHDRIHGWFRHDHVVLRSGAWAMTKHEYDKDIYPPYTLNIGYLFSNNSCQQLVHTANHPHHHINRINDAYITGILRESAQLPFHTYSMLEYRTTYSNNKTCREQFEQRVQLLVCTSKLYAGVRGDPYEYYDIWNTLLAKHNTSGG